jgi:hypothetical protein
MKKDNTENKDQNKETKKISKKKLLFKKEKKLKKI